MSYITASGLSFHLPDNTKLFSGLNFTFNKQRIAIVGKNGVGKTTLFNLILSNLIPSKGYISTSGYCELLPQDLIKYSETIILDILNVRDIYEAYIDIISGNYTDINYETLNNRWSIEDEIRESLKMFGFENIDLYRTFGSFSGGERVKLLLSRILLNKPEFFLMDEPTNNLDNETKDYIYNFISGWKSGIIIISHDRTLLDLVDHIYELSSNGIRHYAGNYSFYKGQKELEKHKLQQDLTTAKIKLKKAKVIRDKSMEKHNKSVKSGISKRDSIPKIVANARKASSETTLSVLKRKTNKKIKSAQQLYSNLQERVESDFKIRVDICGEVKHRKKLLLKADSINYRYDKNFLWEKDLTFNIKGQERILLTGGNGSGKSTLCNLIAGKMLPEKGSLIVNVDKINILDQDLSIIIDELTLLDNVKQFSEPTIPEYKLRIILGGFLFYGDDVFKKASVLSGGEKMRLVMACILSSQNSTELLILDEPTNNLDLDSIEQLTQSINKYKGALIVVSHDTHFINAMCFDKVINLL